MVALIIIIIYLVCLAYALAALLYWRGAQAGQENVLKAGFYLAASGCIGNLLVLIIRSFMTGRLPLSNGAEFLLSFTWIMVLIFLIWGIGQQDQGAGGVIMLIAALFILVVPILMPGQFTEISPLMPALKSPWLTVHVLTVAIAYAGFTLAAALACWQLFRAGSGPEDNRIYRIVTSSFMMLSLSIVFGAIWAEQAWGSYWSWDPKETWALITWIIYAIYLHLQKKQSWQGNNGRIIVILGFLLVLFTFFGVNFLMSGLHSYT